MLAERRTIDERLGTELADGYCGSAVHALGACSVEKPTQKGVGRYSDALYRVRFALDSKAYPDALKHVLALSKRISVKHSIRFREHETLAKAVLDYSLADLCPSCTGIGAQAITGTPVLDDGCPDCNGTGKRPVPWAGDRFEKFYSLVLWELHTDYRDIHDRLIEKLAREIFSSDPLTQV